MTVVEACGEHPAVRQQVTETVESDASLRISILAEISSHHFIKCHYFRRHDHWLSRPVAASCHRFAQLSRKVDSWSDNKNDHDQQT
mmetsp:Transcript_117281/g.203768  ORF Transcript_117281/g.203768 Transcript_117281/m.203768 type:complete len:86 (+) Transcript_117281:2874-3131(+)